MPFQVRVPGALPLLGNNQLGPNDLAEVLVDSGISTTACLQLGGSVEPGDWYPAEKDTTALFSRSGDFEGVQVTTQSTMETPEGAKCTAKIWFAPDTLEKMGLALLAAACREASEQGYKPISPEVAEVVLPVAKQMGRLAGSATFMSDTSYGLAGLLEARHALRSGSTSVPESSLLALDDLLATHGKRYGEYLGGREAYGPTVRV